jgi:hypothetical protein
MIPRGRFFTFLTVFVACAVLTWSCASSSSTASKDETAPKQNGATAAAVVVGVLAVVLLVVLLLPSGEPAAREEPETPPRPDVQPIRNTAINVIINVTFTYHTKKDEDEARRSAIDVCLVRLNEDGRSDGNTFAFPNGEANNFTLNYTLNDEGQPGNDRYTGNVVMSGWGWGYIHTFDSGQYTYNDPEKLFSVLTDQVYGFIHSGWQETRKQEGVGR